MSQMSCHTKLKMLPSPESYGAERHTDPLRFYYYPIVGNLYKQRIENCLELLDDGSPRSNRRLLEVGFGSGVSFLNAAAMFDEIYGIDSNANCSKVMSCFSPCNMSLHLVNGNILKMPYEDCFFDAVLLVSILEHLQPHELGAAFSEIYRVLRPNGIVVYGVPVDRPVMTLAFRLLGYNIKKHHFSSEKQVYIAANNLFEEEEGRFLRAMSGLAGNIYECHCFRKVV